MKMLGPTGPHPNPLPEGEGIIGAIGAEHRRQWICPDSHLPEGEGIVGAIGGRFTTESGGAELAWR